MCIYGGCNNIHHGLSKPARFLQCWVVQQKPGSVWLFQKRLGLRAVLSSELLRIGMLTWTPKVCAIMAFSAVLTGFGLSFYIPLVSR